MTTSQLVSYLRFNLCIQTKDGTDPAYLKMTDADILLFLEVALKRDFPEVESLSLLPNEDIFPLILLAKKELYYSLAVKEAPLYDLTADNNNSIKRSQRFDHYMKLIAQADKEYEDYLEKGGSNNTLNSYSVRISDRYYTRYNIVNCVVPNVTLRIDKITDTSVEVSWSARMERFRQFKVYVSESSIVDMYSVSEKVSSDATLVAVISDPHQTSFRIEGLSPNTTYYIAISAIEMSGVAGYRQIVVSTQESGEQGGDSCGV